MSDKPYYHEDRPTVLITLWVLRHMMRGAGWAALVFFGLIAFYLVILFASWFLPPESKQAPSPFGYLEQSEPAYVQVA